MSKTHRIAVIAGDGIGKEVMPEGLRVLDACARKFGIQLALDTFDWSCDNYDKMGSWMPADWRDQIGGHECLFFGATGWPAKVPDHVSLWDSLIKFRRDFDQYVNMRPVKLMPGIRSPLADRKPGDIDFIVVRENTEGEYSSIGGRAFEGTEREMAVQQSTFTRKMGDGGIHRDDVVHIGNACCGVQKIMAWSASLETLGIAFEALLIYITQLRLNQVDVSHVGQRQEYL